MKTIKDFDFKEKTVFLRVDFNVPLDERGQIRDDMRIRATLPTITYLLGQDAKLVVASHLGRPKCGFDQSLSLNPVSKRLSELIGKDVIQAPDIIGDTVDSLKKNLKNGGVLLLENLRFYQEEKANDPSFAQALAKDIDFYVNDAFACCHRAHASVIGITNHVKTCAAGFLLEKEVNYLEKIIHSPEKPFIAILGGAKVSDKITVMNNLINKADAILIGGAMAYTFFAAQGLNVGRSLVDIDKKEIALSLLKKAKEKNIPFYLPEDHIVAKAPEDGIETKIIEGLPIPPDLMGLDIGPRTIKKYSQVIAKAKMIFWNGPMGVFEKDFFSHGTTEIARAVTKSSALSIIGGGDSVAAVYKAGVSENISHISTGGGASLEFIANETLPGIEALKECLK